MHTSKLLTGAAAAAMSACVLSACSSSDDDNGDDPLVIYSARGQDQVEELVDQFEEQTDIEVEVYYDDDYGIGRVLEEADAGDVQADIFWSQDAGSLAVLADEGVTQTLPEEITSQVDPAFTAPNGEWVGLTGRIRTFVYNTELIDEADVPDNVAAFADPEWEGRIELPPTNATFQAFVTALRQVEGEEAARAWLEGVAANLPDGARPGNNNETIDRVEAGEVEVGLVNHYYLYQRVDAEDDGWDGLASRNKVAEAGDLGSMVNVTGVAALTNDERALEFIEFLLSEQAQNWFAESSFEYPLLEGAVAPEDLPPLEDFVEVNARFDLNDLSDLEATEDLLIEVGLL